MRKQSSVGPLILIMILIVPAFALSQAAQESRTLVVNGLSGRAAIVQVNGRSYIDLEALARVANGSVTFDGNQITLTVPAAASASVGGDPSASASPGSNNGLSRSFLKAGIEAMSLVREWHSALANAIENGFPITDTWLTNYANRAATGLRLASVAISSDSDRNTFPLLNNEFENMKQLSANYLAARQAVSYIAPDALANDSLNKKIVSCGHALAAIAGSGQFVDDGSCQ
jgi:hypothetical protein